jgi:putative oxidoreductase
MLLNFKINKDLAYFFVRFFSAFALIKAHGLPKLIHFKHTLIHIPDPFGLGGEFSTYYAIFTNVFCAFLVAIGLFTRMAALFILSITLTGLFIIHISDSAKIQDSPFIYSIIFSFIAYMGSGKYSFDTIFIKGIKK